MDKIKCNKCGKILIMIEGEDINGLTCVAPFPQRTSGICGGDYTLLKKGDYPLLDGHICFKTGHAMYPVNSFTHERFAEGLNKCSRCGWEEPWRKEF